MSINPLNPETILGNKPTAPEYSDLAAARAAHLKLGPDYVLCGGIDKPYRLLHCSTLPTYADPAPARELPTPFVVQVDSILTQGEIHVMLRRAGLKLVDQGENRPYLLTVEPQSVLSRIGQLEAAYAAMRAEDARVKREHAAWLVAL